MKVKLVDSAKLPTPFAEFTIVGFEEQSDPTKNHVVLTLGDITSDSPVLTRIHSECLTGDALFSLRCDCGFQLEAALKKIAEVGRGILIYHRQEGRNIGILNKIKAYHFQDDGLDTVDANLKLGFPADARDFTMCADMLTLLKVKKIDLLTNNPQKVAILKEAGINIQNRIPLQVGKNKYNEAYLNTKKNKLGHLLDEEQS